MATAWGILRACCIVAFVSRLGCCVKVDNVKTKAENTAETSRLSTEDCTQTPNNQRDLLIPPDGTGWRGSTKGWSWSGQMPGYDENAHDDPDTFEVKYGKPLHVYRTFQGKGNADFGAAATAWVQRGGIIFYSIYHHDYAEIMSGSIDWAITAWANKFKEVAPAKMFICMRFEPELYAVSSTSSGQFGTVENSNKKYYYTPAQYKDMWRYVWEHFKKNGVTNAVWAMDYSVDGATVQEYLPLVAALWPGDEYVDWLFWNMFLFKKQQNHYDTTGSQFAYWLNHSYATFEAYSEVPLQWEGQTYTANFKSKPWGIGAWGANMVKPWTHSNEAERVRFVADAETPMNSGQYPRLKLMCYFDTYADASSEIGNATWRRTADTSVTPTKIFSDTPAVEDGGPPNEDLFEAYRSLVDSNYFNANDLPICSTTTSTSAAPTTTAPCPSWCLNHEPDKYCAWQVCMGCGGC